MTRVEVYKGNRSGCFWLILIPIFLICVVPIFCVSAITAGLAAGFLQDVDLLNASFSEPLGDAESAQIDIDSGVAQINIRALTDSNNLFEGDITYFGEIDFTAGGDTQKSVRLEQLNTSENFFGRLNFLNVSIQEDVPWNIGIAQDIPVQLNIESGVENSTLDLSDLYITGLRTNFGVGDSNITLPAPQESYTVDITSGVGNVTLNLPDNTAIRVTIDQGLGEVDVPNSLQPMSATDENPVNGSGVWETEGFGNAERNLIITINGGVGDITLQY